MKLHRLLMLFLTVVFTSQCDYFKSESQQPLILINPPVLDFSRVAATSSMTVEVRSNINEQIVIDTVFATAPGIFIHGRGAFVLEAGSTYRMTIVFDWDKFNNAAEVRLVVQPSNPLYGQIQAQVLLPNTRKEVQLTGTPGQYSRTSNRPVKFSGNGLLVLYNSFVLAPPLYQLIPDSSGIEVFTMNLLGENKRQITDTYKGGNSFGVDISNAGTRILYYTDRKNGSRNMYLWNETGITDTLTNDDKFKNTPVAFSPDGSRVLFYSNRSDTTNIDAYYIEIANKRIVRLTDNAYPEYPVAWSKDGTRVLIKAVISGQEEITLSTLIGQPLRLTNNSVRDIPVDFSPDGNRILFYSDRSFRREIYTMALNGSDVLQLTNNQLYDFPVTYTPDGLRILYYNVDFNNNAEIFTVDTKGSLQSIQKITSLPGTSEYPVALSPDGKIVLYYSERQPGYKGSDIFTIRLD